ncbi:phosphodiesterase [Paraburkholderia caribensis]|uniref:Phosphodiesterase n=1 Tax=Paraburkholderia caribensis TaxID=75105 RepID=A0A9Q6RZP8_9BURK|nr:phosphodiesterase [Paraburkholderia caribensis]MCO4880095.1 phosphodiesterase [Paraburkholderia caribensis]MDR6384073.1 3',5'-cyclic AMP phosphodiesterase CpdA [Paraburkholderia caribensis]PTB25221.1 phosphodiesterase [Paraburkholderia caribensis]QLB61499.1 phosphodiesterase [Paraburkholderia caribensis]
MLIAQISDLHIKRPGALAYRRVDTAAYLSRCVERLNALAPAPDAIIITGDLVDQGEPEQYEHLKSLLAPLKIPYYLLVGNHDDRTALRATFIDHKELHTNSEFIQYTVDIGPLRLIALDSMVPGQSAGLLCDARLAWLEAQLQTAHDKPVIVALHHPPFVSGIGHMDALRLDPASAKKLAALIARHPNVERVICGHVHRPMFVRFAGTIASAVPAPAHQVALDLRDDAPSAFMMEPPAFALHRYDSVNGLITHHAYVDAADGPYPFYEPEGSLID